MVTFYFSNLFMTLFWLLSSIIIYIRIKSFNNNSILASCSIELHLLVHCNNIILSYQMLDKITARYEIDRTRYNENIFSWRCISWLVFRLFHFIFTFIQQWMYNKSVFVSVRGDCEYTMSDTKSISVYVYLYVTFTHESSNNFYNI